MAVAVVLGGGGFIGSNLVARLLADGHTVKAVDVQFPTFRQPPILDAALRVLDLTEPRNAEMAMYKADWVFHLAADMGGVGYFHSPADLGAALRNGRITNNVLTAALKLETPRLFYSSSACAYPIELQQKPGFALRLDESRLGRGTPDALYGAEKLQGLRLCSKVPGARVGVLHTVYGPLQEHEGRRMKFPAAVATKALAARDTGRLELWGDGQQLRSYLYVDDAVDRIVRIMEADHYDGPVNVGAQGAVSCVDVARMCLDLVEANRAEIVMNPA
jgi:GDP-D-mannose 3',5'-epimerase